MAFETIRVKLTSPQQARAAILAVCEQIKPHLYDGRELALQVKAETRSQAQNRIMWACLSDIARQVEWHGQKLSAEDWKVMATAALKQQRVVPGIGAGSFVVLGERTSEMTRGELSEMVDFLHAFGTERGVRWSRTSLGRDVPNECFEEVSA